MFSKSKKPSKPQPVEPVAAEEIPVPEPVSTAPDVQDPVEPVDNPETAPVSPVEADAAPEGAPVAEPEGTTPEAEANPVHAKPFSAAVRDPRLPPVGATITRQYKGQTLEVLVLETGFMFNGETYSSISKVAASVSGAKAVNGFAFFKLGTVPGGKQPRSGAGTARLASKIARIEGLVVKLRVAVEAGQTALAEAEAEVEKMKGEVGE